MPDNKPSNFVEFVSFDPEGVITKESWQATVLACPRCGQRERNVWLLISEPPLRARELTLPLFLCIACLHVAVGLNGFDPVWDKSERAKQIIKFGFVEE